MTSPPTPARETPTTTYGRMHFALVLFRLTHPEIPVDKNKLPCYICPCLRHRIAWWCFRRSLDVAIHTPRKWEAVAWLWLAQHISSFAAGSTEKEEEPT